MGSVEMRYDCHINYDDCDFCNECVECCSGKALTISNNQIQFQADKCTNCEVCSDVCPVGAIWIETLEWGVERMTEKRLCKFSLTGFQCLVFYKLIQQGKRIILVGDNKFKVVDDNV